MPVTGVIPSALPARRRVKLMINMYRLTRKTHAGKRRMIQSDCCITTNSTNPTTKLRKAIHRGMTFVRSHKAAWEKMKMAAMRIA